MKHLRTIAALFGAASVGALAAATPALATQLYNSDNSTNSFDATTSGSLPAGWTAVTGTWVAQTAATVISSHTKGFGDSGATNGTIAVNTGATASADMQVSSSQVITTAAMNTVAPGVRGSSNGQNGYLCLTSLTSAGVVSVNIALRNGGSFTFPGTKTTAYTMSGSSDVMNVRAVARGTTISCKVWSASVAEPTSNTMSVTDSTITAAGYAWTYNSMPTPATPQSVTDFSSGDTPYGSTNSIQALMPAPPTSGTAINFSFYATGTAPTSVNYAVDGSTTFNAVTSLTGSSNPYTVSIPSQTAGYHQFAFQLGNATTEVDTAPVLNVLSSSGTLIAPTNAAIVKSPYNWDCASSAAVSGGWCGSINAGAELRTMFTGTTCTMNFNVASQNATYKSEIYYRLDGYEAQSPWVRANVASTVSCAPSSDTSNANYTYHLLEIVVKSTSQNVTRWANPSPSEVLFTGLTIGASASVVAPATYSRNCLMYLDSRGEGVLTVNQTATNDADQNDVLNGWAWQLAERLGCEPGIVAFGGQGLIAAGTGSVPNLNTTYNLINSGVTRTFTPAPDLVVFMEGVNDSSATASAYQSAAQTFIGNVLAATPSTTKMAVLEDFSAYQQAATQAAVAAVGSTRATYIDTTGVFSTAYGSNASATGVHPTGANDLAFVAPRVLGKLTPLLNQSTPFFRPTIH